MAPDIRHAVKRSQLLRQDVGLTTQDVVGAWLKAIELEVDRRTDLGQFGEEAVVTGDPLPVRIEHHMPNVAALCRTQHLDDLGMDAGFAS